MLAPEGDYWRQNEVMTPRRRTGTVSLWRGAAAASGAERGAAEAAPECRLGLFFFFLFFFFVS